MRLFASLKKFFLACCQMPSMIGLYVGSIKPNRIGRGMFCPLLWEVASSRPSIELSMSISASGKDEVWRSYGWKPIVSESQAHQLLRHELKHHRRFQQKNPQHSWSYEDLLRIKKGNWYKYSNKINGAVSSHCSILILVPSSK